MTETWHGQAFGQMPSNAVDSDLVEDTKVLPLLTALSECLCGELALTPGGTPCFCGVVPGQLVPMDYCDCDGTPCGMAWVRLDSAFPSAVFPQPADNPTCTLPLAVRVQVGVTRCVPGMDNEGRPPGVLAQAEAVRVQMADMMAARRAIACCVDSPKDVVLGSYTALGPAGPCGGGVWTATLRVL